MFIFMMMIMMTSLTTNTPRLMMIIMMMALMMMMMINMMMSKTPQPIPPDSPHCEWSSCEPASEWRLQWTWRVILIDIIIVMITAILIIITLPMDMKGNSYRHHLACLFDFSIFILLKKKETTFLASGLCCCRLCCCCHCCRCLYCCCLCCHHHFSNLCSHIDKTLWSLASPLSSLSFLSRSKNSFICQHFS